VFDEENDGKYERKRIKERTAFSKKKDILN